MLYRSRIRKGSLNDAKHRSYNRHHCSHHRVRHYSRCNASSPAGIVMVAQLQRSRQRWKFSSDTDQFPTPIGRALVSDRSPFRSAFRVFCYKNRPTGISGNEAHQSLFRNSYRHSVLWHQTRGSTAMKKLIELLDDEDRIFAQQWADANVAVFSSALLVEIFRGIVGLLFG